MALDPSSIILLSLSAGHLGHHPGRPVGCAVMTASDNECVDQSGS